MTFERLDGTPVAAEPFAFTVVPRWYQHAWFWPLVARCSRRRRIRSTRARRSGLRQVVPGAGIEPATF